MICFACELKVSAFSSTGSDAPVHFLTNDGKLAFGQLLNRAKCLAPEEPFLGAIVDRSSVLFWKAGPRSELGREWKRWPATPLRLASSIDGFSGLDFLRAVLRVPVAAMRASTADPEVLNLLLGARAIFDAPKKLLPYGPLLLHRPVVLGVYPATSTATEPKSIFKAWPHGIAGARLRNEIRGLGLEGCLVEGATWMGLHLEYCGPTTMGGMVQYIDAHASHLQRWRAVLDVVGQVGAALLMLHERGLVHCDVKPANVVLSRVRNGRFTATLVDYEHTVERDKVVPGYTTRFASRAVAARAGLVNVTARRGLDWEALFFSSFTSSSTSTGTRTITWRSSRPSGTGARSAIDAPPGRRLRRLTSLRGLPSSLLTGSTLATSTFPTSSPLSLMILTTSRRT